MAAATLTAISHLTVPNATLPLGITGVPPTLISSMTQKSTESPTYASADETVRSNRNFTGQENGNYEFLSLHNILHPRHSLVMAISLAKRLPISVGQTNQNLKRNSFARRV